MDSPVTCRRQKLLRVEVDERQRGLKQNRAGALEEKDVPHAEGALPRQLVDVQGEEPPRRVGRIFARVFVAV